MRSFSSDSRVLIRMGITRLTIGAKYMVGSGVSGRISYKTLVVVPVCNHQEVKEESQKFKVTLSYIVSFRLAWDTQDPFSCFKKKKKNQKNKKKKKKHPKTI